VTDFQPAIFDRNSRQHLFLELILRPGIDAALLRQALAEVAGVVRASWC